MQAPLKASIPETRAYKKALMDLWVYSQKRPMPEANRGRAFPRLSDCKIRYSNCSVQQRFEDRLVLYLLPLTAMFILYKANIICGGFNTSVKCMSNSAQWKTCYKEKTAPAELLEEEYTLIQMITKRDCMHQSASTHFYSCLNLNLDALIHS